MFNRKLKEKIKVLETENASLLNLKEAVINYLKELDNPIPDYNLRRRMREYIKSLILEEVI